MKRRKAVTVIGTRPQFIKYAAVAAGIRRTFDEVLVDTGQHYDPRLSTGFLDELGIAPPKYNLRAEASGVLPQIADMLSKLDAVLRDEAAEVLICLGDTNSTLAAALSGVKFGIPVVHIEAGERNFTADGKRVAPTLIPEETNRMMTDLASSVLLCASERAVDNLRQEHAMGKVIFTGDIMYSLHRENLPSILRETRVLDSLGLQPREYYFCTVHRALNTDHRGRLGAIVLALARLDKPVVLPLHPRTDKMLRSFGLMEDVVDSANIRLIDPVGYAESLELNYHAAKVITDSGGVLREAFFNGVPSIYLDDTTEWIDIMYAGWSNIAGADAERILAAAATPAPTVRPPLFGEGDAVMRTEKALVECFT